MSTTRAVTVVALGVLILINFYTLSFAKRQCTTWPTRRDFRDCTCGIQYSDYETNCEDSSTYYDPILGQTNFSCPFKCENDGHLFRLGHNHYFCACKPGFAGICCEMGKEEKAVLKSLIMFVILLYLI